MATPVKATPPRKRKYEAYFERVSTKKLIKVQREEMQFFWQKIVFFTFLSFLLFVLFLFGETYLSYYAFGLLAVFLLIFQKKFPLKPGVDKKLVLAIVSFLLLCVISLIGSDSFYSGIVFVVRLFLLFTFLLTFLCFDFQEKERDTFLKYLLFGGVFLCFLALVFLVFPNFGSMIPAMNLLFSSYGHNHIGTLFVMLAPVGQYLYLKEKKKIYLICSFLFYFFIIVGFGRVLLLISVLQGVFFLFLLGQKKTSKKLRIFFSFLLFLLVSALLLYFFSHRNPLCSLPNFPYKWQICKSDFALNLRDLYWEQALQGFREKPLFGHGSGGFSLVSYKYRQIPELWSGFAHNDYLQILVEGGILGAGAFIFCLFLLVQKAAQHTLRSFSFKDFKTQKKIPLEALWVVSLFSFLFDIFFDFNFVGFFFLALTFFFLCSLFYTASPEDTLSQQKNVVPDKTLYSTAKIHRITTSLCIAIILFVSFYGVVDGLIFLKKEETAFRIFPYFHYHSLIFVSSDKLSLEDKLRVVDHLSYTLTLHQRIIPQLNGPAKIEREFLAFERDPWRKFESFLPVHYLGIKDQENLEKVMALIFSFFKERQAAVGFQKESIGSSQKEEWAQAFIFLAGEKNKQGDFEQAVEYLKRAHFFDQWSLAPAFPLFITLLHETPASIPKLHLFFSRLSDVEAEEWGDNREVIARMYFKVITQENWEGNEDELLLFIQKMIDTAPWSIRWFQEEYFTEEYRPGFQFYCFDTQQQKNEECVPVMRVFHAVSHEIFNSTRENEYFDKRFYKRLQTKLN